MGDVHDHEQPSAQRVYLYVHHAGRGEVVADLGLDALVLPLVLVDEHGVVFEVQRQAVPARHGGLLR